jgi:hypothetical protein
VMSAGCSGRGVGGLSVTSGVPAVSSPRRLSVAGRRR